MGRRPFDSSQYVENIDEKRNKCRLCNHIFSGGATRIKAHLEGLIGKGIKPCQYSKTYLEAASVNVPNKRAKTVVSARKQGNTQFTQFLHLFLFFSFRKN